MLTLIAILAWAFLLCLSMAFVALAFPRIRWSFVPKWLRTEVAVILCLILVTLGARVVPVFFELENNDTATFTWFADWLVDGRDVYSTAGFADSAEESLSTTEYKAWNGELDSRRNPYFPVAMYLVHAAKLVSRCTGWPFIPCLKIYTILADVGLALALYSTSRRLDKSVLESMSIGLLYALNPVTVVVTAYHGQLASIPMFFSLLAWCVWQLANSRHRDFLAGALLGIAISIQSWPAVFALAFLRDASNNRKRIRFLLAVALLPIVLSLPYPLSRGIPLDAFTVRLLRSNLLHKGDFGMWGGTWILQGLARLSVPFSAALYDLAFDWGNFILLGLVLLFFFFIFPKTNLITSLFNIVLLFYAFTAGWGIQWMVWIVPFLILAKGPRRTLLYSIVATVAYLAWYAGQFWGDNQLAQVTSIIPGYSWWQILKSVAYNLPWALVIIWVIEECWRGREVRRQVARLLASESLLEKR